MIHDLKTKHKNQSGNIFFMLFASVALIGAFTVGSMNTVKGIVTSMSEVTRKSVAEEKMTGGARLAIQAATSAQINAGDCDDDGYVEPLPYRDAGSAPHPTGGGLVPLEIGAAEKDPWGIAYGYCVWDAGAKTVVDNEPGCGGNTAKRLNGSPHAEHSTVAIISAGKDRKFSSTCNVYVDTTPVDNQPDTALITRAADSDDIVMEYSYDDANGLSGDDLWRIRDTKPDTAAIDKNIDVTGAGQFTGPINLMESGLILPDETVTGACDTDTDQQLRVNYTTSPPALEICDFTGGNDWTPVSMGGTGAAGFCTFSPTLVDTGTTGTYGYEATADLLLSGNGQTFRATDISDPLNIAAYASFSGGGTMDGIRSIAISGDYAYTANETSNSISVVDISTAPSTTVAILQDAIKLAGASDIEIYGTYAIVAAKTGNRITVVDISNPLVPVIANSGNATIQDNLRLNAPNDLAIYGDFAVVASSTGDSVTTVDLTNPLVPIVRVHDPMGANHIGYVTSATYLDGATNVEVSNDYAFVTTTTGGYFTVLDVIDGFPVIIARIRDTGFTTARDLKITGNYAFVATNTGLIIVDISNPFYPSIVTTYTTGGNITSLEIQDEYAYLSQASANVIDLGCDPAIGDGSPGITNETISANIIGTKALMPVCEASASGPLQSVAQIPIAYANGFFMHQGYFFARQDTALTAFSMGADEIPVSITTGPWLDGFWSDGTYIYGVSGGSDLYAFTFDGTVFATAATINNVPLTGWHDGSVFGDGTYVYVNNSNNLKAYTFNGTTFTLLATFSGSGGANHAWTDGTYIYMSDGAAGLRLLQFNGTTFTSVATLTPPLGSIGGSYSDGNYLYFMDSGYLYAYTFDGTVFTQKGSAPHYAVYGLSGDGANIFITKGGGGAAHKFDILRFDGTTFTTVASMVAPGDYYIFSPFASKNYIYVGNWGNATLYVLSGFQCGSSTPSSATVAAVDKFRGKLASLGSGGCGIKPDNSLWCWGGDGYGQVGNGAAVTADQPTPVRVDGTSGFSKVYAGFLASCGIKVDGTGWCWGSNSGGRLGVGAATPTDYPRAISGGHIWSEISSPGETTTCGIRNDGTAWCWGDDTYGTLGNGASGSSTVPSQVSDAGPWSRISTVSYHACGIKTDGSAWCWGYDAEGQLGNNSLFVNSQVPVPVAEPGPWIDITAGQQMSCGVKADGTLWCWGKNTQGAAGYGEEAYAAESVRPTPQKLNDPGPWVSVKAGVQTYIALTTCGIKGDGTAWCWGAGYNYFPTQLSDPGPWASILPGSVHRCGMKFDGSTWCWGNDSHWQYWTGSGLLGNDAPVADQWNPVRVANFPEASPWVWDSTNTTVTLPLLNGTTTPNMSVRSGYPITYDGTASTGLTLTSMGSSTLTGTTKSELLIDSQSATGSAQISWSNSIAAVVKSLGIDYLTGSLEFGDNVAAAIDWMDAITPQFEITANGNVGAGTTGTALYKLEITGGGLRLGTDATACSTFNKGTVRYVGGATPYEYCNGTAWTTF